jgi:hypothetical protein
MKGNRVASLQEIEFDSASCFYRRENSLFRNIPSEYLIQVPPKVLHISQIHFGRI